MSTLTETHIPGAARATTLCWELDRLRAHLSAAGDDEDSWATPTEQTKIGLLLDAGLFLGRLESPHGFREGASLPRGCA
jgi:hypothetical protein